METMGQSPEIINTAELESAIQGWETSKQELLNLVQSLSREGKGNEQ